MAESGFDQSLTEAPFVFERSLTFRGSTGEITHFTALFVIKGVEILLLQVRSENDSIVAML